MNGSSASALPSPEAVKSAMNRRETGDLLALAVQAHGGEQRWEELSWFRAAVSITGAIWALKGRAGLFYTT